MSKKFVSNTTRGGSQRNSGSNETEVASQRLPRRKNSSLQAWHQRGSVPPSVEICRTREESKVEEGFVLFQPKGVTHIEEGLIDQTPRDAIVIDLKDRQAAPLANKSGFANAFPREGAVNRLENDRVVIWEYRWAPGRPTPMHFHDKDAVVVMEGGELESTTPDGKRRLSSVARGEASFSTRNRSHSEKLVSGAARAMIVELK